MIDDSADEPLRRVPRLTRNLVPSIYQDLRYGFRWLRRSPAFAAVAVGPARTLARALYGISPLDPVAWDAATMLLLSVAAAANLIPAGRALADDPLTTLRRD